MAQFAGERMFHIQWSDNMRTSGLSILRELRHDPRLLGLIGGALVSSPVPELAGLRNGTLAHEDAVSLAPGQFHAVKGTGGGAADAADVVVVFQLAAEDVAHSVGVCVLAESSVGGAEPASGVSIMAAVSAAVDSSGQRIRYANVSIGECGSRPPPPTPTCSTSTPGCVGEYIRGHDMMGGDYKQSHLPPGDYVNNSRTCQGLCKAEEECTAWTYIDAKGEPGEPANSGDCFLKRGFPCPGNSSATAKYCTSGYKLGC